MVFVARIEEMTNAYSLRKRPSIRRQNNITTGPKVAEYKSGDYSPGSG
jgi:hypothetical protein